MTDNGDNVDEWFNQQDNQEEPVSDEGSRENPSDETEGVGEEEPASEGNTDDNESAPIVQEDRSLFLDFLKMIVALIFVLALIYFLLKFIQKRSRIYQQSRSLENIGGLGLGSNKSVQIIRVGNQYYLIGVGEDVQLITEIDDPSTIEDITSTYDVNKQDSMSFQKILKNFQNRHKNPYQEQETKRQFQSELQSMKNTRERMLKRYQNRNEDHDG